MNPLTLNENVPKHFALVYMSRQEQLYYMVVNKW